MIRFINLKGQIFLEETFVFAWYDTITDTFQTFNGSQTWDSWDDFVFDCELDENFIRKVGSEDTKLRRYLSLFPARFNMHIKKAYAKKVLKEAQEACVDILNKKTVAPADNPELIDKLKKEKAILEAISLLKFIISNDVVIRED